MTGSHGSVSPAISAVDYSVSLASQVQSGAVTQVTLTAIGTNGRTASTYTGTANLLGTGGAKFYASSTPSNAETSVNFTAGVATVYVQFTTAGWQTITATDSVSGSITGQARPS